MEVTSKVLRGQRGDLCPGQTWKKKGGGYDKADHLGSASKAPAGGRQIRISPGDVVVTHHVCDSSMYVLGHPPA